MDVQKRFLKYWIYPKYLAAPSVRRGDTNEGLNNPSNGGYLGKHFWLTGNVRISTANRLSILKILRIIHDNLLHFAVLVVFQIIP